MLFVPEVPLLEPPPRLSFKPVYRLKTQNRTLYKHKTRFPVHGIPPTTHMVTDLANNSHNAMHTSSGEILAIVDSGTSKHIFQCRTLLANAQESHIPVASFSGDTSRSTYSGDLLCTVRTEDGKLLPLSDSNSALAVPDAKRPLWSVRHAQQAAKVRTL
jgi:hypothetical protein